MRDVLTGTNNQALFDYSDQTVYEHQGLRFRSATEVKIYDELVRRHLLFEKKHQNLGLGLNLDSSTK